MVETVHFGEGMNIDGDMQQLYADVYQPYGDTVSDRPVVIFAFGGGFVQGSRNDWYVREVCEHFARSGYVCVANDYRLGIDPLEILFLQHMRIFFRPMQDMRATVQYLKADFSELGNNYRIDTNKIFLGGASAGAISALMTEYCDKPSEMEEMGDLSALDELGGFYATSGFYPNYTWDVAAVVNVAGALINAEWIESGDVPHIGAHGDQDNIVPYEYGPLGGGLLGGVFDLQGSYVVHQEAVAKGVCSYLYTMEGQDHPNEGMGIEYIKSVVHRISQRAYAVLNDKSFCCDLTVDVQPNDTLRTTANMGSVELNASLTNDNGNASLQWCSVPCAIDESSASITVEPDTSWRYLSLIATEGGCQASDLYIVLPEELTSIDDLAGNSRISIYPIPSTGLINVSISEPKLLRLEVHDLKGQLVVSKSISSYYRIDANEWSKGTYVLRLIENDEVIGSQRLIIN
jgi:dienelactone hydrolase